MLSDAMRFAKTCHIQLKIILRRLPTTRLAIPIPTRITQDGSGTVDPEPIPEKEVT
jgi:hypothetical protein